MSDITEEEVDADADFRQLLASQGVSPEQQDEILADITLKASPEYLASLFPPKPSLYFCLAERRFTAPPNMSYEDVAHLNFISRTFSFLLNTSELRRRRVTYPEFAQIIRAYSSHGRSEWCAAFLEQIHRNVSGL